MTVPTNFFRQTALGPVMERTGLVAIDIGARGGFDPDLLAAAWCVDAVGFEPEPDAYARLEGRAAEPWRSFSVHPIAIGGTDTMRRLHITTDPEASSLLRHDRDIGRRFEMDHLMTVEREVPVDTLSLVSAAERFHIPPPHYLKLDVEGPELEIINGASAMLSQAVAIKTEAAFIPMRQGQPLVWDMVAALRVKGFELIDIIRPAHWRTGPNPPHPYVGAGEVSYSRGQIVQSDLLFLRDAERCGDAEQRLRLALVALVLGYFDHARRVLARPEVSRLMEERGGADVVALLPAIARGYGRAVSLGELRARLRSTIPLVRSLFKGVPV